MFDDSHIHLLQPELKSLLQEESAHSFLLIASTAMEWTQALQLKKQFPHLRIALGLNPFQTAQNSEAQIKDWLYELTKLFCDHNELIDAVGETGFHFPSGAHQAPFWESLKDVQQRIWEVQFEWALKLKKPLIMHSVGKLHLLYDWLHNHFPNPLTDRPNIVWHGFYGSEETFQQFQLFIKYWGVGKIWLKHTKQQELWKKFSNRCELNRILLETDLPWDNMNPVSHGHYWQIKKDLVENLSSHSPWSAQTLSQASNQNFKLLFSK